MWFSYNPKFLNFKKSQKFSKNSFSIKKKKLIKENPPHPFFKPFYNS